MTDRDVDFGTSVLVVDDDKDLADTYALWLKDNGYDVQTATGGDAALEQLQPDIDVIMLDRRMPKIPGDVVLKEARERKGSYSISMLTAVEPDESVLDLAYDEYLVKPVTKSDVVDAVERLTLRESLEDDLQELFRLTTKKSTLEAHTGNETGDIEEEIDAEIREKQDRLREKLQKLDQATDVFSLVN